MVCFGSVIGCNNLLTKYVIIVYNINNISPFQRRFLKTMQALIDYFKSVSSELEFVKWPSKQTTIVFSVTVIVVSIAMGIYLGFTDYILSRIVEIIVK